VIAKRYLSRYPDCWSYWNSDKRCENRTWKTEGEKLINVTTGVLIAIVYTIRQYMENHFPLRYNAEFSKDI